MGIGTTLSLWDCRIWESMGSCWNPMGICGDSVGVQYEILFIYIQSKPAKWGTWPKNWFRPTQMTPAKRGDIRKTGRLTNRHFLRFIYCFGPLSVFLGYLSSSHMADAQMPPVKKAKKEQLTLAQRQEILAKLDAGASERTLANEFGVGKGSIGRIKANRDKRTLCPPTR